MPAVQEVINSLKAVVQEISKYPETDVQDHPILVHIANALRASVDMLQKVPSTAIPGTNVDPGTQEQASSGVDRIPEVKGDEDMDGLSKAAKLVALAKKYPDVAEVLNMAKDHPMLAKLITTPKKLDAPKVPAAKTKTAKPKESKEAEPIPAGFVRIEDSNGDIHDIPESAIVEARKRDPGLKVMQGSNGK